MVVNLIIRIMVNILTCLDNVVDSCTYRPEASACTSPVRRVFIHPLSVRLHDDLFKIL